MKKNIILLIICLCSLFVSAQTGTTTNIEVPTSERTLNAPIGLTFGMYKEKAKAIMFNKKGKLDVKRSVVDKLIYGNVKVGGKMTDFIVLLFVDNKLFDVSIYYFDLDARQQENYDKLKETIDNKYGFSETYRTFKSPYTDGDGYEMQAIKVGKGSITTYWSLKNGIISLEILVTMNICVGYQDTKLADVYFARKKKKEAADF
jgi:hypothetical protein